MPDRSKPRTTATAGTPLCRTPIDRRGWRQLGAFLVVALLAALLSAPVAASADEPSWDTVLNDARADAGLPPVQVRDDWAGPARQSSEYMVRNGRLTHDLTPTAPGYTAAAAWAAETGNLVASTSSLTEAQAIGRWLDSPGHAFWVLHPQLAAAGFGDYHDATASPYPYAATLPVIDGLDPDVAWPRRTTYPADGADVSRRPKALYVVAESLPTGSYTAAVTADGTRVTLDAVTRRSSQQLAVQLSAPLPRGARVTVEIRRDAEAFESFAFTTVSATSTLRSGDDVPEDGEVSGSQPSDGAPSCAGTPLASFPDVPSSSAHAAAVGCVAALALVNGYADGGFHPSLSITREQVATVLDRTLAISGLSLPDGASPFTDVGGVHADAVIRLATAGIVTGRDATTFDPSAEVTRGQLVLMLDRAATQLGSPLPDASGEAFGDVGSTHAGAVSRAVAAGIVAGYGDGTFRPHDPVRRDHAASLLARWIDWRASVS